MVANIYYFKKIYLNDLSHSQLLMLMHGVLTSCDPLTSDESSFITDLDLLSHTRVLD